MQRGRYTPMQSLIRRQPQRVLMTADTVGGVWTFALELARALQANRVEVILATMGAPLSRHQRHQVAALPNLKVHASAYKLEWMHDCWADVTAAGQWLLALENWYQPDVVHLNGYAHGALGWQAPVLITGHSCVLSWWEAVKGEPAPAAWAAYRQRIGQGLQAAALVTAPSAAMLQALDRHYRVCCPRRVITNGRDAGDFSCATKEPLIFGMGRIWDEAKNMHILVDNAMHLDWPIRIAGSYEHPDQRGRGCSRSGSLDREVFLGHLSPEDLRAWLGRSAIYALPARYEPFGFSALEAALSGCALVLSDLPSLREVWGDAALYAPANDSGAFVGALQRLIRQPQLLRELAQRASIRAQRYSAARMATNYLQVYRHLMRQRRGAAAAGPQPRICL